MVNTGPIHLFSPLFLHLKISAVTPPMRAAMPTSNRKHASAKTPLLPLAISKTVTKSWKPKIICASPNTHGLIPFHLRICCMQFSTLDSRALDLRHIAFAETKHGKLSEPFHEIKCAPGRWPAVGCRARAAIFTRAEGQEGGSEWVKLLR